MSCTAIRRLVQAETPLVQGFGRSVRTINCPVRAGKMAYAAIQTASTRSQTTRARGKMIRAGGQTARAQ